MILACTLSSAFGFHMPSAMPSAPAVRRAAAPAMAGGVNFPELDGSEVRVGIIRARWHPEIIDSLIDGAKEALKESGVKEENIIETEVPGAFELPLACRYLALSGAVDAVVPVRPFPSSPLSRNPVCLSPPPLRVCASRSACSSRARRRTSR